MKNIKRVTNVVLLSSIISLSISLPSFAATNKNQNVSIYINQDIPEGGYKPGDSNKFVFDIKNNLNKIIKLDEISILNKSRGDITLDIATKEMTDNTMIDFKYNEASVIEKSITLTEFLTEGNILLNKPILIDKDKEVNLVMEMRMNEQMGNSAQSVSNIYSFSINYKIVDNGSGGITPPSPSPGPENPDIPNNPDNPNPGPDNPNNPDIPNNPNNPNPGPGQNKPNKPGSGNDSDVGGSTDKLPQTGGFINSATLTILGLSIAGVGIALDRKSSSKKGGKTNE